MFAVAEKGNAPDINIFDYPDLNCIHILRGGTEKSYAFIDYKYEFDSIVFHFHFIIII